jgi:hypothetical protein
MNGLKEGDWARTDMGREGTVVVMSADGMRAYIERDQTSILDVRLSDFPLPLQKIDPPNLETNTSLPDTTLL